MGNRQHHPQVENITDISQLRGRIRAFNKTDQSLLRSLLGFSLSFQQHVSCSIYQSYGNVTLHGRLAFSQPGRNDLDVQLSFSQFLQLRDMMKNLVECQSLTPTDSKQLCCVCLDRSMTLMLPCSHAYCPECIEKYVLDLEQKKCPQCRRQFKQPKQNIQGKLTEILDNQKQIAQQLKLAIRDLLYKTNPHIFGRL